MKKNTRKSKIAANNDKPAGKSKYAKKLAIRRRLARKNLLPENLPYPVLWFLID